jgi:hypothetical protein
VEPTVEPTIGRIVHYHSYGTPGGEYLPKPRAAIVTDIFEGSDAVSLCVLNPTGLFFNTTVAFSETPEPGCWSWPPRI